MGWMDWSVLSALLCCAATALATELHVDQANGNDGVIGKKDAPLRTLGAAMGKGQGGDVMFLGPGNCAAIDVGADGTVDLEAVGRRAERTSCGRLAPMNDLANQYHRTDWTDVRTEVTRPESPRSRSTMIMFPGREWQVVTPESQGMNPAKVHEAVDYVRSVVGEDGTGQMVIVRNGAIVWQGENVRECQRVWSCTKSFLSTCIGLAWGAGKLTPDALVKDAVPEIGAAYSTITLGQLSSLTSGYVMDEGVPLKPLAPRHAPGAAFHYSRQPDLLAIAVTRLTGSSLAELFRRGIAGRIGIGPEEMEWQVFGRDGEFAVNGGSGGPGRSVYITPLAMARFGWLYACNGMWDGERVISQRYIDHATVPRTCVDLPAHDPEAWYVNLPGNYGMGWWTNGPRPGGKPHWPHAPARTFAAQGNKNNNCFIIPDWRMVVVRLGQDKIIDMCLYDRMFELLGQSIGVQ